MQNKKLDKGEIINTSDYDYFIEDSDSRFLVLSREGRVKHELDIDKIIDKSKNFGEFATALRPYYNISKNSIGKVYLFVDRQECTVSDSVVVKNSNGGMSQYFKPNFLISSENILSLTPVEAYDSEMATVQAVLNIDYGVERINNDKVKEALDKI